MTARIHVDETIDSFTAVGYCTPTRSTPQIDLHVEYDHGDTDRALTCLQSAYRSAVAQIEETR